MGDNLKSNMEPENILNGEEYFLRELRISDQKEMEEKYQSSRDKSAEEKIRDLRDWGWLI